MYRILIYIRYQKIVLRNEDDAKNTMIKIEYLRQYKKKYSSQNNLHSSKQCCVKRHHLGRKTLFS